MITKRYKLAEKFKPITIGRIGENITTIIKFPLEEFGSFSTIELMHERNGEKGLPYFCDTTRDDEYIYWEVRENDLANVGLGRAEFIAKDGEGTGKSYIYETRVLEALGPAKDVPPPYQPWVDSVLKEFAFSHKLENITCHYISIPHDSEPHCDSEETEDGLILTFYIPMGEQGEKGDKGDDYILTEEDKEEIASQIHYDDSELREMIDAKASIIMLHSELTDGTWSIKNADGDVLTYAEIKALHNKEDYIVCLHENVIHSTSFLTDAIEFMGTYYINEKGYISRLIINSQNVVKADGYALENAENRLEDIEGYEVGDLPNSYPSTDALVEYLKDGNNLPKADGWGNSGVVMLTRGYGLDIGGSAGNLLYVSKATDSQINARANQFNPIVSNNLDYAVKSALTDGKGAPYTEAEKKSARERIGAEGGEFELIADITLEEEVSGITIDTPNGYKKVIVKYMINPNTSGSAGDGGIRDNTYSVLATCVGLLKSTATSYGWAIAKYNGVFWENATMNSTSPYDYISSNTIATQTSFSPLQGQNKIHFAQFNGRNFGVGSNIKIYIQKA